jgi:hypothetical protein
MPARKSNRLIFERRPCADVKHVFDFQVAEDAMVTISAVRLE